MNGYARYIAHHTIVAVDIEGFCDRRRTLPHQLTVRSALYGIIRQAFAACHVPWAACYHEDRGDGLFLLVPGQIPKTPLVEALPYALVAGLRRHNSWHAPESGIRLRLAVHAGEVAYDEFGVTADAVNLVFRLLDAPPLREALADSTGVLAMITSDWFYGEVVRHSAITGHLQFRPVRLDVKETSIMGWVARPDLPVSAARPVLAGNGWSPGFPPGPASFG